MLSSDADEMIAQRAAEAMLGCAVEDFVAALQREDAPEELFKYCAEHLAQKPGIADAMAENINCPAEELIAVAPYLKEAVNLLVDDLDRISSTPGLVTALVPSSYLGPRQRAALEEIQKDAPLDEMELVRNVEALAGDVPDKKERMSLYQQVSKMKVIERMQLAIKGGRDARGLLIRDPNKMVQRAVLQSPKLTDQEVEQFAGATSLNEEVLRIIAGKKQFMKNYTVMRNLTFNPKAPLDLTLGLMNHLLLPDLKGLAKSKNVPETLRNTAAKLLRQRTTKKTED